MLGAGIEQGLLYVPLSSSRPLLSSPAHLTVCLLESGVMLKEFAQLLGSPHILALKLAS